jgi:large subunit ribosomal protein L6
MTSRVARKPITLPKGVEVKVDGQTLQIKGSKGIVNQDIPKGVIVEIVGSELIFKVADESRQANQLAGTTRALSNNIVFGVSHGYEKKLILVGVGYRAQVKGKILAMTLGFSHPVDFPIPEGITIETPTQTEVVIKGIDKQQIGQVAANIRKYRPPEPYKGKGIRYSDEKIKIKETKKK